MTALFGDNTRRGHSIFEAFKNALYRLVGGGVAVFDDAGAAHPGGTNQATIKRDAVGPQEKARSYGLPSTDFTTLRSLLTLGLRQSADEVIKSFNRALVGLRKDGVIIVPVDSRGKPTIGQGLSRAPKRAKRHILNQLSDLISTARAKGRLTELKGSRVAVGKGASDKPDDIF